MCQNNCGTTVHNALQSVMGVQSVTVSFPAASASVTVTDDCPLNKIELISELIEAVECVGFDACIMREAAPTHVLSIVGMMCQKNCGTTVQRALSSVPGVLLAEVSFEARAARVWGSLTSLDDLVEAVEDVGFEAMLAASDSGSGTDGEHNDEEGEPDVVFAFMSRIDPVSDPKRVTDVLMKVDGVVNVTLQLQTVPQQVSIWGFIDIETVEDTLQKAKFFVEQVDVTGPKKSSQPQGALTSPAVVDDTVRQNPNCFIVPLLVGGMSCANCSKGIENRLMKLSGILAVRVALLSGKVEVHYDVTVLHDPSTIAQAIVDMGYSAQLNGTPYAVGTNTTKAKKKLCLQIFGMSCNSCSTKIEDMLLELQGVTSATVSCETETAIIELDDAFMNAVGPRDVMARIDQLGYKAKHIVEESDDSDNQVNSDIHEWRRLLLVSILLGGPVVILHFSMIFSSAMMDAFEVPVLCGGGVLAGQVLMVCLNAPLQCIVGYRFYRGAYLSALHRSFGMDALVVTGTTIAFVYSSIQLAVSCASGVPTMHVFFETSGMLLLFVTMGKYFEAYAKGTTISAMTSLLKLQPRQAVLVTKGSERYKHAFDKVPEDGKTTASSSDTTDEEEELESIDIDLIQKGDIIKVYPGARLPTDGIVVAGSSNIDESLITGESMPVSREVGSTVYGSTVNQKGLLYVQVTSVGSDSALAQIVQLVESAQMDKAPIQAYADVIAGVFTPTVLCLAVCTFSVWFFLSTSDRIPTSWYAEAGYGKDPLLFSLLFCISVVVISCPCALGLATPTAIMVGTSVGASNGILIKGGPPFEVAHRVNAIIFDKTGTLTKGKPTVTDEIDLFDENTTSSGDSSTRTATNHDGSTGGHHRVNEVIRLAAMAEVGSEHPLGESIMQAAKDRQLLLPDSSQAVFSLHQGGVSCSYPDGTCIRVGNREMMQSFDVTLGSLVDSAMWDLEVQGKTAVGVVYNSVIVGILGIADVLKPEAMVTVQALQGMDVDVWMVTGDNKTTAEAIGDELGIPTKRIIAGAFPGDKVKHVEALQKAGKYVAMVGDGINDSPALARAELGIAVGAGTHIAIDAADMVIVRNNLLDVIVALDLAKVVFGRIRINLRWALLYNVLAIPIAAGAFFPWFHTILPPQYAGLCMALSSVSVVTSSLMLKCYRRPRICTSFEKSGGQHVIAKRGNFLSKFTSSKVEPGKISTAISRARGRLSNLKAELTRRVSSQSDNLGEYSPLPVSTGGHESGEFGLTDIESDGSSLSGLHGGDVEMMGGRLVSGLPAGGLPPSLEWDE